LATGEKPAPFGLFRNVCARHDAALLLPQGCGNMHPGPQRVRTK
jgi:hypothetical protein